MGKWELGRLGASWARASLAWGAGGGRLGASWASALGRLSNISKGGMGLEGPGEGGGLGGVLVRGPWASWGGGLGEGRLEMS